MHTPRVGSRRQGIARARRFLHKACACICICVQHMHMPCAMCHVPCAICTCVSAGQAALAVGRAKERHDFAPEMISLVKRNSCGKVHRILSTTYVVSRGE